MKTDQKNSSTANIQPYEKPAIEIIEVEHEGIICASSGGDDFNPGGGWGN